MLEDSPCRLNSAHQVGQKDSVFCWFLRIFVPWAFWCLWGGRHLSQGRSPANLDRTVFIIDHQTRPSATYHTSCGSVFLPFAADVQFTIISLNLAAPGLGIDLKSGLLRKINLHFAIAVANFHTAQLAASYLDRAVFILQAYVSGDSRQAHVFGAGDQPKWSNEAAGAQIAGIHIEIAVQSCELKIGAGRFEADGI